MGALKVAILGAGFMGEVHFHAWQALASRGVEVVAIARLGDEPRAWLGDRPPAAVYHGFERALEARGIDIVDICLPTPLHRRAIEMAAAAGKAVLCEKPLARTAQDAEAAVETVRRHDVPFMVAHVVRFFPDYRLAREVALHGEIGQARSARTFRGGALPAWNTWMRDEAESGGVILDMLIHDIDFLRWVFGPIARVHAVATAVGDAGGQHAALLMRFKNDAIAMAEGAWSYPPGSPFQTEGELAGTAGLIQWSSRDSVAVRLFRDAERMIEARLPASPLEPDPFQLEIEHFLDHVTQKAPLAITPEDAAAAVRVAEAATRSAREGKPVEVNA
ncbi:MAG: Gfo/Idh/MocA family oxidoreductase [Bacillota bacterium]